jgi:hypothetical protein
MAGILTGWLKWLEPGKNFARQLVEWQIQTIAALSCCHNGDW